MLETVRRDSSSVARVPENGTSGLCQTRYLQVLLMFLCFTTGCIIMTYMSIATVAMTDSASGNPDYKEYDWNSTEIGYILSSFYWGYVLTQIPAGYAAKYWSATNLMASTVGLCALSSLLMPLAAEGGWPVVCACRALSGFFEGCFIPCLHTLLANWSPPCERTRLVTITYAGGFLGAAISSLVSGVLAESAAGWPSIFYVFGGATMVSAIVFFIFSADSPSKHSWISEEERQYIESSLCTVPKQNVEKESNGTPWRAIVSSVPFWALLIAHCGQKWRMWLITTYISIFMNAIIGLNMFQNGFMSALPYLVFLLLVFPASWLFDYALKKGARKSVLRKAANTASQWGSALAFVGMCFTNSGAATLPVIIFTLLISLDVGSSCGFQVNHLDLSPNNAGILMSVTSFFASIVSVLVPVFVSAIVTDQVMCHSSIGNKNCKAFFSDTIDILGKRGEALAASEDSAASNSHLSSEKLTETEKNTLEDSAISLALVTDFSQWQIVFYATSAIQFVSGLIFLVFGSTDVQWWDDPKALERKQ